MKKRAPAFDAVETQAAAWLARHDGGLSSAEAAEFSRWCAADPRHAEAVQSIRSTWEAFDRPSATGQAELLREELRTMRLRDRRRSRRRGTAALMAVAACAAVYFGIHVSHTHSTAELSASVATAARISTPDRQTLPDGSVVEFKQGAEIDVAFTEQRRRVILKKGEAHFSVTSNPRRPFIVTAGSVSVRAVGTAFAVQLGGGDVEVLVTEGKVTVSSQAKFEEDGSVPEADFDLAPLVAAGQGTRISLGPATMIAPVITLSSAELAERLAWRVPRLEFSETSVAEAIALFNRHNTVKLRAAEDGVAAMRMTGVFRADNVEGFVRALETSLGLRAEYVADEVRLVRAR